MRRPILVIFVVAIIFSYIYTNSKSLDLHNNDEYVCIEGIIKSKKEKERYNEYIVGKFLVRDFNKNRNLAVGHNSNIKGKFKSLDSFNLEFDYGRYLRSIGAKGVITLDKFEIKEKSFIYYYAYKVKYYVQERLKYLYKEKYPIINSLILGDKNDIDEDTKELFSKTGVSHIIALSGLHIGIICTIMQFILKGINRPYKLFIYSIIMLFYIFVTGFSPSIIRAFVFSMIIYIAIFIEERSDAISSLSLIGTILVVFNPYIIHNISFQLSFLATLSIIYFYGFINKYIKVKLISLTISASILTIPIIYYNYGNISIISTISNILVVPFVSIIIYLAILSIIISSVSIILTDAIVKINILIIEYIYKVLESLYNIKYSFIEFKYPKLELVIIYYIVVFLLMIYKELKIIKEQKNGLQGYHKKYEAK